MGYIKISIGELFYVISGLFMHKNNYQQTNKIFELLRKSTNFLEQPEVDGPI